MAQIHAELSGEIHGSLAVGMKRCAQRRGTKHADTQAARIGTAFIDARSRRTRHRIARAQRRALQRVEKSRRVADAERGHVVSCEREQSAFPLAVDRFEGSTVGQGWVRTCISRWATYHVKKIK